MTPESRIGVHLNEFQANHRHARRHHRLECRCQFCAWDGFEPCRDLRPCGTCRYAAQRDDEIKGDLS